MAELHFNAAWGAKVLWHELAKYMEQTVTDYMTTQNYGILLTNNKLYLMASLIRNVCRN